MTIAAADVNILRNDKQKIKLLSRHWIVDSGRSRTINWNFVKVDMSMRQTPSRHVQYSVLTRSNHGGLPNEPCSGRLSSIGSLKVSAMDNNHYQSHMTQLKLGAIQVHRNAFLEI